MRLLPARSRIVCATNDSAKLKRRARYYLIAALLSILGCLYCVLVYSAGEKDPHHLGSQYLESIPNYWLFYIFVLPFFAAGVLYLAFEEKTIRFSGKLSERLDDATRAKIRSRQRLLLPLCLPLCVAMILADAYERKYTLPPYAYQFSDAKKENAVISFYACKKGWEPCPPASIFAPASESMAASAADSAASVAAATAAAAAAADSPSTSSKAIAAAVSAAGLAASAANENYRQVLRTNGVNVTSATGWHGLGEWWVGASKLFMLECILSLVAALFVYVFAVEIVLLIKVKDLAKSSTKNLVIWISFLISLWFPTIMYSYWFRGIIILTGIPPIVLFGTVSLLIGVILIVFIKTDQNDITKYSAIAGGIVSLGAATLVKFRPELFLDAFMLIRDLWPVYAIIAAVFVVVSLSALTENLIDHHEQEDLREQ